MKNLNFWLFYKIFGGKMESNSPNVLFLWETYGMVGTKQSKPEKSLYYFG